MRMAYELGYASAFMFTRQPLQFLSLDGISFKLPVPIGSILRLRSVVAHSKSDDEFSAVVHVQVQANVIDPTTGEENLTNTFHFTWVNQEPEPLRRMVLPESYLESMQWLEGRRALAIGAEIRASTAV